jgi:hypothetical protein
MAYWADILHAEGRELEPISTRSVTDEIETEEVLSAAGLSSDNVDAEIFADHLLEVLGATSSPSSPRKKILPLPGFLRKPVSRAFLKAFVGDSAAYFFREEIRNEIQKRLRDELPSPDRPLVLVTHSQGTVVALEVLSALRTPLQIIQIVTLGSPLGIREIQDHLSCDLVIPKGIERWHNFSDPLDPVAFDKGLRNDFQPRGEIHDEVIVNTQSRRIFGFNPHSAVGYLAHPSVRRVIHAVLRSDPMARFVVARDVAEVMAWDDRHPVLIELLEPHYPAYGEDLKETVKLEQEREDGNPTLERRVRHAADELSKLVGDPKAARIEELRRFVAAHLTPSEIRLVTAKHQDLRVYAVWRSSSKHKLITRSGRVLQTDAALQSYGANGEGIKWAVLDTGVRTDHPHFAKNENVEAVWDCTVQGPPVRLPQDNDRDGHGSHVSGIIAGESEHDKKCYRGMAPKAKLIVYKVLNDKGEGEDAWIIKALDHIAFQNENNAQIAIHGVNLSLGGPYDSTVYGCGFSPICAELRRLWRSGVLIVVACGNEGQLEVRSTDGDVEINTPMSIGDPANLEDCIAVGSINADKPHLYGISSFSSRGPTSDGRCKPDVVAPGERIASCNARYSANRRGGHDPYYQDSGTSMAAPHVSGLLAAFLSVRREFRGRPDEVKRLLLETCTDLGRDRHHQGHGIPNLMKMLLSV